VRVFVTGATGFVMGPVAHLLRGRGDEVRALVRDRSRAGALAAAGCELVVGDLAEGDLIRACLRGCDAAIHGAGSYEIGIDAARRRAMEAANVRGTERVLAAALEAGTPKIVYVSTIAVFGNTRGRIVDERDRRQGSFTSYYEETKHRAHEIARDLTRRGLPCVIVQPGQVYGPGDHSGVGRLMRRFAEGRLPALVFGGLGLNLVHVDDVARGVIQALDRGSPGESYVLGGEITTLRGMIGTLGRVTGRRPPRLAVPDVLLRLAALTSPALRETVSSAAGVTFWARDEKARRELGYAPRTLERGLRDTFGPRSVRQSSSDSSDSNSSE